MSVIYGYDGSKWQSGLYTGGGGFDFAFWKAAEGVGYVDPTYYSGIAAIRRAGLIPGAYTFNRPDLGNTPEGEADFLLAVVGDPTGMLLAPDLEVAYNGPLLDYRARFLARIAQRCSGYRAPWYSYWHYITTHALNTADTTWCWLAWPDENGPLPGVLVPIRMQQYGLTSVPGLAGGVDANRFFGTRAELQALVVGGSGAAPTPPKEEAMSGSAITIDGLNFVSYVTKAGGLGIVGSAGGLGGLEGSFTLSIGVFTSDVRSCWLGQDVGPYNGQQVKRLLMFFMDGEGSIFGQGWPRAGDGIDWNASTGWAQIADAAAAARAPMYQGQTLPPGPVGPPGPKGEAVIDDDHITKVALKAVNDVTKAQ